MTETYDPLDFEFEDPIPVSPPAIKKKKKVIGLDDLLADYEKEQKKLKDRKSKRKRIQKVSEAEDEFDDATEARVSECVDKCQKEMNQIVGDDEIPVWGIKIFQNQWYLQKNFPQIEYPGCNSSSLLQSFNDVDIESVSHSTTENGEKFLEELLVNGWLLNLVHTCGKFEKTIATWVFHLMLYSSNEKLMEAACEFWCHLLSRDKADLFDIELEWLPRYSDLKGALENYGFHMNFASQSSLDVDMVTSGSGTTGPPENITSWIKCSSICFQSRDSHSHFSTFEAEEFLVIIISLFLDRRLIGLSLILHQCILSVINFFRNEEWLDSCQKIAKSVAKRLPVDINCLRVVESISGIDDRSKQLRSKVAFQFLVGFMDRKICNAEEVFRVLISINLKDKDCDLLKMYIYLNLAESWLLIDPVLKDNQEILDSWGVYLRNCSTGIAITDSRSYASNVRNKASYLLQGTVK